MATRLGKELEGFLRMPDTGTEAEWNTLAAAAGFKIEKIRPPGGPWPVSLLELLPI